MLGVSRHIFLTRLCVLPMLAFGAFCCIFDSFLTTPIGNWSHAIGGFCTPQKYKLPVLKHAASSRERFGYCGFGFDIPLCYLASWRISEINLGTDRRWHFSDMATCLENISKGGINHAIRQWTMGFWNDSSDGPLNDVLSSYLSFETDILTE